jgi:hypothetical protein
VPTKRVCSWEDNGVPGKKKISDEDRGVTREKELLYIGKIM